MPSVGEQLRQERESHDATLEQISQTTKIDPCYLEALERDDFAALPGWAFGKFYIRAYAEVLGFDPERLIAEYESERVSRGPRPDPAVGQAGPRNPWQEALRKSREEAREKRQASRPQEPTPAAETLVAAPTPELPAPVPTAVARPTRRSAALAVAAAGLLVMVAFLYWAWPHVGGEERAGTSTPEVRQAIVIPERPSPVPPASKPHVSHLTVPEFGVGRAVVERALSNPSDRFAEGSVAWFQTLVLGGKRGETIRHVWLREGKAVQSIELKLGGARWRTHSSKTLYGAGSWTVEVRDAAGQVLARAEFGVHADS